MAELRAPEAPRDHATLDKALKKIDKAYYTDELLTVLTLNDKQFAWTQANVPDEPAGKEEYVSEAGSIVNPVEVTNEDGERVVQQYVDPPLVATPGPVAGEEEIAEREANVTVQEVLPEVTAADEQAGIAAGLAAAEAAANPEVASAEEVADSEDAG